MSANFISVLTEIFFQFLTLNWKKIQLVHNWIFIPVWNECWNGNFKKPVEINRGIRLLSGSCQDFVRKLLESCQPQTVINIKDIFFQSCFSSHYNFLSFLGDGRSDKHCPMSTVSYISFVMVFITTMINVNNVAK